MRPFYKCRLIAVYLLCFASVATAQQIQGTAAVTAVPRLVRFAGSFHSPVNPSAGPVGATFAIYSEQEGGTPLWTEDRNVELDANGNYTVLLGSTHNEGVPVELFTAGEARWLQVKFYVPGEVDLPRVLLVSVPYALKAGDADTLAGRPASAYALAGAATLMQTEGPSQPAAAMSARTAADVTPLTSSGSPGYIAKFTNTTDVIDSVMYQNNTSIGINTTTPLDVLHVAGSITTEVDGGPSSGPVLDIRNTPPTGFGIGSIDFYTYPGQTTPSARWRAADIGGFTADQTLYTSVGGARNAALMPRLTVKGATGYLGIGTTSPAAPLEVKGDAQVDGNLTLSGNILTAVGFPLIQAPNNASNNFSAGLQALSLITTGSGDTAVGDNALHVNTTGYQNTAVGYGALGANATGFQNTAIGYNALYSNTIGNANAAIGVEALISNTTGGGNTANGAAALPNNTTGFGNTASGNGALYFNATGNNNIAIGWEAGFNVFTTSNNIHIGNQGTASDSGAIRIGTPGTQTSAFISGIRGVTTGNNNAVPVLIDSNGQLGTISSSRRFKEDIQDMDDTSSGLMRLRPVTFRYKKPFADGSQPIQYGLIAEEVAEVYPDLVAHSADGQIETVKYQLLDSMLLNELQKQNATIAAQKEKIHSLEERLAGVEAALERTSLSDSSRQ